MKIKKISLYEKEILLKGGGIKLAQSLTTAVDSRIIKMETDTGITGWGESVPWGTNYVQGYSQGISSGMIVLAPMLLGANPLALGQINQIMDDNFSGHPYIKAALDMACWDILGKVANLPCYEFLGGKVNPKIVVSINRLCSC